MLSLVVPGELVSLGAAGLTYVHTVHSKPSLVRSVCEVFCSKTITFTCSKDNFGNLNNTRPSSLNFRAL